MIKKTAPWGDGNKFGRYPSLPPNPSGRKKQKGEVVTKKDERTSSSSLMSGSAYPGPFAGPSRPMTQRDRENHHSYLREVDFQAALVAAAAPLLAEVATSAAQENKAAPESNEAPEIFGD